MFVNLAYDKLYEYLFKLNLSHASEPKLQIKLRCSDFIQNDLMSFKDTKNFLLSIMPQNSWISHHWSWFSCKKKKTTTEIPIKGTIFSANKNFCRSTFFMFSSRVIGPYLMPKKQFHCQYSKGINSFGFNHTKFLCGVYILFVY